MVVTALQEIRTFVDECATVGLAGYAGVLTATADLVVL